MLKKIFSKTSALLSLTLFTVVSGGAFADVSLRNGNFFMGFTHINYPGGYDPKIESVFNSKSPFNGIFGWGWSNDLDVRLTISADASVIIHEYGGGAQNRFNPVGFTAAELDGAVNAIADAARKTGTLGSADQLATYKKKLKTDAMFRNDEWEKFRTQRKLKPRVLALNSKLTSTRFSFQYVTVIQNGYTRTYDTGLVQTFDANGRLTRMADKNGNFIALTPSKDGKVEKLQDNFNRKMFFTYNERGKLLKIQGENNKNAEFKYNADDELVYAKDADGVVNTFKYSSDKRHNLVEVGYGDKTNLQIAYYGRDQLENVKSVRDRDGTLTEYTYGKVTGEANSYKVGVKIKTSEGIVVSDSNYDYVFRNKATGEEWTYRMVSSIDGLRTETTYNECCGMPLLIKRGTEETAFVYDPKGRVTKKSTPDEITELAYDAKVGKVSKVLKYPRANKKKTEWSQFQYDARGNLTFAKNSSGQGVGLYYDKGGRILSMLDQVKRRINFKYNENSKPVEITDPAVGSIQVSYTNSGEVKNVDSKGGRKIAMQVTSAFQNLLEIIRPAGVTLTF